jgi:hypothetical protein
MELEIEQQDKILDAEQKRQVTIAEAEFVRIEKENLAQIEAKKIEIKMKKEQFNKKIKDIQNQLAAFISQRQGHIGEQHDHIKNARGKSNNTTELIQKAQRDNQEKYQTQKARID